MSVWTYHPELLANPVPRYTSYPTAAEFHDAVGSEHMAQALGTVATEAPLSLYVHIPYCREICWYCGCNTGAANRAQRLTAYLEALHAEIDLVAGLLEGRGRVTRIAFGGGSPNAIAATDFLDLVNAIAAKFRAAGAMLSVELDPRTLDSDWIDALAASGVSRTSLGVQTLAPEVQQAIGRVQPIEMIRRAVDELRRAGVGSINFDLMYGLPRQSLGDLAVTLALVHDLAPERIALFGYAHVPHLIPRQRRIAEQDLADAATRFGMARLGHEILTGASYQAVGFDHFARPDDALAVAAREGKLRRNFQGFTEDSSDILIGLGASAISAFPDRLIQNDKNAGRYRMKLSAGRLPSSGGVLRSAEDRLRGRMIESLLCRGEADLGGLPFEQMLCRLAPFRERGLVTLEGSVLRLAPQASPYARSIAACFDVYRQSGEGRFSNAV